MNRTRRTEHFPAHAEDGLLAVTSFDHPVRGPVSCPAAPVLAAWLDTWGVPTRTGPLRGAGEGDGRAGTRDGRLVATTYVDPGGAVRGIAVLAPDLLVETATAAVSTWSACLRTRRLLVPVFASSCDPASTDVPGPRAPGLPVLAGTCAEECPHRALLREAVLDYRKEHGTVLVVGQADPGGDGLVAGAGAGLVPVPDRTAAAKLSVTDPHDLAFVVAPCTDTRTADRIVSVLRERFPLLRGQHPDQWCYRSTDNRYAAQAAVANSDLALLLQGAPAVPPRARNTLSVRTLADLRPTDIAQAQTIALLGPPAELPPGAGVTVADLVEVLSGLGPASVVHQRFTSDVAAGTTAETERRRRRPGALGRGPGPDEAAAGLSPSTDQRV
ncbi:hypothetical protein [Kitasatospora sp. NPDC004272]